jgi:hypothetical protein
VFKPTVGELLAGISAGLRQSVLPALEPGDAQRQLKAALHGLGRLQRSWDLLPAYLSGDNDDMCRTLLSIRDALQPSGLALPPAIALLDEKLAHIPSEQDADVPGIHERSLALQATMNVELQTMLIEFDAWLRAPQQTDLIVCVEQRSALDRLYGRMVDRELHSWGTDRLDE